VISFKADSDDVPATTCLDFGAGAGGGLAGVDSATAFDEED